MLMLKETKKSWLVSFIVIIIIAVFLLFRNNSICTTIAWLIFSSMSITLLFFLVIVFMKRIKGCRGVALLLFLLITIYEGINNYIEKWYVIIPAFIILCTYMFWYLGGVKNCIIVSMYKMWLEKGIKEAKELYAEYLAGIENYNIMNNGFLFRKIKVSKEPAWERYKLKLTAADMFEINNAFVGVDIENMQKKVNKVKSIISNLYDKNEIINSDKSMQKELELMDNIISEHNIDLSVQYSDLLSEKKKNVKQTKKTLRKKLEK